MLGVGKNAAGGGGWGPDPGSRVHLLCNMACMAVRTNPAIYNSQACCICSSEKGLVVSLCLYRLFARITTASRYLLSARTHRQEPQSEAKSALKAEVISLIKHL